MDQFERLTQTRISSVSFLRSLLCVFVSIPLQTLKFRVRGAASQFRIFSSRSSKTLTVCELIWLIILYDSYTNFNQPIGYRNKILSSTYLFSSRQVRNIFGKFSKFNYGWVQVWHWWPTLYSGYSRELRNRKRSIILYLWIIRTGTIYIRQRWKWRVHC